MAVNILERPVSVAQRIRHDAVHSDILVAYRLMVLDKLLPEFRIDIANLSYFPIMLDWLDFPKVDTR